MLTEIQIRNIYEKYFPEIEMLTTDTLTSENCILFYYTEEELEAQCQRLLEPSLENFQAYQSKDAEIYSRAISSNVFNPVRDAEPIAYELSLEYQEEQLRTNGI